MIKHRYSSQMQSFGTQHPSFLLWHSLMRRRVRVFDNGGRTADRYSVLIQRTVNGRRVIDIYGMSAYPFHPQGINQYSHTVDNPFKDFRFLGKIVAVQNLPPDVIKAIEDRI